MKIRALFALAVAVATAASAQDVPQHIDIHGLTGEKKGTEMIDDVVVPVPAEIFAVLDKLEKPNWPDVLHPIKEKEYGPKGTKEQISLILGIVIAEGFVAVEAENAEEVKNIGRTVLPLAEGISVRKAVVKRSNAIIEAADKKDWKGVRKELDGALTDVRQSMTEVKNADDAKLVSLGGWLRGTEALTVVVEKNYSKDGAELLHQPVLLNYFKKQVESMKTAKKDPLVQKIHQGLIDIEPLMGDGNSDISEKSVKDIQAICTDLIKAINQKQN